MHKCLIEQSGWSSPGARKCRYRRESQPRYTTMQQICGTVLSYSTAVQPRCAEELVLTVLYVPCAAVYKVIDVLLYSILSYLSYPSAPPSAGSRDTIRGSMPAYSFSRYLLLLLLFPVSPRYQTTESLRAATGEDLVQTYLQSCCNTFFYNMSLQYNHFNPPDLLCCGSSKASRLSELGVFEAAHSLLR